MERRIAVRLSKAVASGLVAAIALTAAADAAAKRPHRLGGTELHVANWGRDWWPGTERRPFRTITRAQQAVRARTARMRSDITVNIHRGTYRLSAPLELSSAAGDSGENGHDVIYQAHDYGRRGQDDVTISGGREVDGWKRVPGTAGVWRTRVGALDTRQLYVAGRRAERARLGSGIPGTLQTTETGYVTDSVAPQSWRNPEDIELSYRFDGVYPEEQGLFFPEPRCGVADITGDADSTTITMDQPCFRRARAYFHIEWLGLQSELIDPTEVENSPSFLTNPGTFYLDRSDAGDHVLYYMPRPGEDLRRDEVVAPVLETLVKGEGTHEDPLHDIALKGLTLAHATWLAPNGPGGFIHFFQSGYENGDPPGEPFIMGDATHVPGNVVFRGANRILLEGNRLEHLGGVGLEISQGSSDNVVRGNVITDVSQTGITVGEMQADSSGVPEGVNRGNRIENNWLHAIGVEYHGGGGMFLYKTQDTTIAHNQVNDIAYSGITTSGQYLAPDPTTRGAKIVDNLVFDTLEETSDGGGIYLSGPQGNSAATGAVVSGNVVHTTHRFPNIGIYTDQGANWGTIERNVVYDTEYVFGGCSLVDNEVENMIIRQNFSDDADYIWACGAEVNPTVSEHTLLGQTDPEAACQANATCAGILANAGLEPAYRQLLAD